MSDNEFAESLCQILSSQFFFKASLKLKSKSIVGGCQWSETVSSSESSHGPCLGH